MKIGVIGAGHLGKIHIKCLQQIPDWELLGFFDKDEGTRDAVSGELDVRAFDSAEALMDACDAVDIVTNTPAHYELASAALARGCHVFVEKPVTATPEEGHALIDLARRTDRLVQVGHVERFNPAYLAVRDRIGSPLFIEGHRLSPYKVRGNDISVIMDLMIHDLDLVLKLMGRPVAEVHANGVAVISDTPDICHARISFEGGGVVNLTASRLSLKPVRKMRIFQRDAYLSMDFLERQAQLVHLMDEQAEVPDMAFVFPMELPERTGKIVVEQPQAPEVNAIVEELRSFYRSIDQAAQAAVTLEDAVRALDLAFEIEAVINRQNERL